MVICHVLSLKKSCDDMGCGQTISYNKHISHDACWSTFQQRPWKQRLIDLRPTWQMIRPKSIVWCLQHHVPRHILVLQHIWSHHSKDDPIPFITQSLANSPSMGFNGPHSGLGLSLLLFFPNSPILCCKILFQSCHIQFSCIKSCWYGMY